MTRKLQRDYEVVWAKAFLSSFNKENNSDYVISNETVKDNDYVDVDVVARSLKNNIDPLYLQLTSDSIFCKKYESGIKLFNLNNFLTSINKKLKKYERQNKIFSDIILLIQGSAIVNDYLIIDLKELSKIYINSNFKNIYYMSPPKSVNINHCYYIEDWSVIKIK